MAISDVTRRNIVDEVRLLAIPWSGRLGEIEFLKRLYNLQELQSGDPRFENAEGDIWQHRVRNYDWDEDWVWSDPRFDLLQGAEEIFLRFLSEMVHPLVRPEQEEVNRFLDIFNRRLRNDGWEIAEETQISGIAIYAARPILKGEQGHLEEAGKVAKELDASYIGQQITRLRASVDDDPELAIGTAKEFVETTCKSILEERECLPEHDLDFPQLVRLTLKELRLAPDNIPESAKAAETIRILLSNLGTVSNKLAELRNPYGSGHGKTASARGLEARHARLAVGAATTLAVFLFETHKERRKNEL